MYGNGHLRRILLVVVLFVVAITVLQAVCTASGRSGSNPTYTFTSVGSRLALYKDVALATDSDAPGTGSKPVIVDVVDPVWKTENISIDGTTKTVKVDLIATDKYLTGLDNCTLTTDDITLSVDGDENANTAITKTLSDPTFSENVTTGMKEIKYTLTLDNWEEATLQDGKSFFEYSGTVKIKIKEGTITDDASGATDGVSDGKHNTSKETEFEIGHVDFIKPRIIKGTVTRDVDKKTVTITFGATDKYLDTTSEIDLSKIKVYVDGEEATGITKTLTRETAKDVSATINGKSQVVSQQYKLVLSDFEQSRTAIDSTRNYADWSGTVTVDLEEGVIKDKESGGVSNTNDPQTVNCEFVDFIAPKVTYKYVNGDINYNQKTFTMKFDVTDKYFTSSTLATEYANATTDAKKLEVIKKYLTIKVDGEDITNDDSVTKKLIAIEDVKATKAINKTIDGTIQEGLTHQVIGKSFTLEISGLQQDMVDAKDQYLDYSGVITVAVKPDVATDNGPAGNGINKNGNINTTMTSGVDIPGEDKDGASWTYGCTYSI